MKKTETTSEVENKKRTAKEAMKEDFPKESATPTPVEGRKEAKKAIAKRIIDLKYLTEEKVPAEAYLPNFSKAEDIEFVKNGGDAGLRVFDWRSYDKLSPFLVLNDLTVGRPLLFPDHPHYGHDFALYVLEGEFTHEDFTGVKATLKEGELHWMTAGKGIVHAQKPGPAPKNRHLQWFINVPKDKHSVEPRNQFLTKDMMPQWEECQGKATIKLIAGQYGEHKSEVETFSPMTIMDVRMNKGADWSMKLPDGFTVGMYVLSGKGKIEGESVSEFFMALSKGIAEGDSTLHLLEDWDGEEENEFRVIVFAGMPLNESVDMEGFFVTNEPADTKQAMHEYEMCEAGFVHRKGWHSELAKRENMDKHFDFPIHHPTQEKKD